MVSIIILSYNTRELIIRCLTSIEKQLKSFDYEIIIVDNNSYDDSVNVIRESFPKVKLIESKKNLGFAGGCNLAAKRAKGEYLLFLNSDTELRENTPEKLLRVFAKFPEAGVVGGMLENADGTLQRSSGSFYTLRKVFIMLFGGDKAEIKRFNDNAIRKVDWVSGGCLMISQPLFNALNGYDEHFFMYVEDVELCFRVHKAKRAVYIDPSSIVMHVGQGSSDKTFAIINIYTGLKYFYKKHANTLQYSILLGLLRSKALMVITIGKVTRNNQLVHRYSEALKVL